MSTPTSEMITEAVMTSMPGWNPIFLHGFHIVIDRHSFALPTTQSASDKNHKSPRTALT